MQYHILFIYSQLIQDVMTLHNYILSIR